MSPDDGNVSKAQSVPLLPAILAAARKELRIYFRYPTWPLALLIWPTLFPLAYIFTCRALAGPEGEALGVYAQYAETTDYVGFILTGTVLWGCLNMMLCSFGASLRTEQLRGTLEVNWLTPTAKWFLLAGGSLADILRQVLFLLVAGLEFHVLFGFHIYGSPYLLLLVLVLSVPSMYGLGFIFASIVLWAKEAATAVRVVRGVMMVFCGTTYPICLLPGWMQAISRVLPLTHSVQAVRAVVAGAGWSAVAANLQYLSLSGTVLLALGFVTFSRTQRITRQSGSLGHY